MSRSRELRFRAGVLAVVLCARGAAPATAAGAQPSTPEPVAPADAAGPVEDIAAPVESLDGTESEVQQGSTVTVTLTSDVLFAFDEAELTDEARTRLQGVAAKLAESTSDTITIEGHTDDQGDDAYNDDLSLRRANAVRDVLAQHLGGQGKRLEADGRGEREPRVPNLVDGEPNEQNRAQNRRVEIVFDAEQ